MAFFDWDGNGKKDFMDDYIEYKIYEECTKDDDNDNNSYHVSSSSNNTGCASSIIIIAIILFVAYMFVRCTTSYCSVSGCDNECTDGSSYCYMHDMSYRLYGSPTYYKDRHQN